MDRFGDLCLALTLRLSSGDLVCSRVIADGSYGLKLDFGVSFEEPLDSVPGDSLSRLLFVLFSIFARSFGFGESDPIALHVCASRAKGLDLESNVVGRGDKYSGRMY